MAGYCVIAVVEHCLCTERYQFPVSTGTISLYRPVQFLCIDRYNFSVANGTKKILLYICKLENKQYFCSE